MGNVIKTEKERVYRNAMGLETDRKVFVEPKAFEKEIKQEAISKYNDQVEGYVKRLDDHAESLESFAKQFNDSIGNMEIKAINNNAIVQPFSTNPFQKIRTSGSGLIIDTGGLKPLVKSNETGDYVEEESFIHVGTVFDAGPECKWIKDGDIIMWTKPSEMPIPFYKQNLVSVNETRVLCVINEGLTDRFNNK